MFVPKWLWNISMLQKCNTIEKVNWNIFYEKIQFISLSAVKCLPGGGFSLSHFSCNTVGAKGIMDKGSYGLFPEKQHRQSRLLLIV